MPVDNPDVVIPEQVIPAKIYNWSYIMVKRDGTVVASLNRVNDDGTIDRTDEITAQGNFEAFGLDEVNLTQAIKQLLPFKK